MTSRIKISDAQKGKILDLWVQGYTYRIITEKTGMSTATISGVINELLETEQDFSELIELSLGLKKTGVSYLSSFPSSA